jgi:hypothetical protein
VWELVFGQKLAVTVFGLVNFDVNEARLDRPRTGGGDGDFLRPLPRLADLAIAGGRPRIAH